MLVLIFRSSNINTYFTCNKYFLDIDI